MFVLAGSIQPFEFGHVGKGCRNKLWPCGQRVAVWPACGPCGQRVAGWPACGRVAGWPGGRVAGWPSGRDGRQLKKAIVRAFGYGYTVRVRYVGMARRYGVLVQFTHRTCFQTVPTSRNRTVPAPYPHRTHGTCTVRPHTDAQVVPSFTVPGHPIEHNS